MNIAQFISDLQNNNLDGVSRTLINHSDDSKIDLSIVMTAHDREDQTMFTLKTIAKTKDVNYEIVLVEDSPSLSDSFLSFLSDINIPIQLVRIDYDKKRWINPCINYNIGFHYSKGNVIIIQNAEVCHFGNIIRYALDNTNDSNYLSFDVCTTLNLEDNKLLREDMSLNEFFSLNIMKWWYQHTFHRNKNFHFLTSISRTNLQKLKGFDYDYAQGLWYDDDEFVARVKYLGLNIQNVQHESVGLLGVHQHHSKNTANTFDESMSNKWLHDLKLAYLKQHNQWLYLFNKQVVTITGIRPDFIRMKNIFSKLDTTFNHILVHTGQHYDPLLSTVFFKELGIRPPNYNLNIGKKSTTHYEQTSLLSTSIIELFQNNKISPDLIIFLGDSNSVVASIVLKKQGYRICHIEAGMRSFDMRMFEEINRKICDACSELMFVYHENYAEHARKESPSAKIQVVGNTIVEVCKEYSTNLLTREKTNDFILMDIHRPENFQDKFRLEKILNFANQCIDRYSVPLFMIGFPRTIQKIKEFNLNLGKVSMINLLSFQDYLEMTYHSKFLISDSGTGQEEPALLKTKVVVPRDFTERPESYENNCSIRYDLSDSEQVFEWIESDDEIQTEWLGQGNTSYLINKGIIEYLFESI